MLSFFSLLMNVSILWSNDVIHIPVGDNLEAYKSLPEAVLYMDDAPVTDKLMYYEYEINYTSFSVIRTHMIGTYTVWYRAHFPTLGFESDIPITFIVYDHLKPEIQGSKDMYVDVGTKALDYKSFISYSDNYNDVNDLMLTIYSGQVNLNQVGTYQVTYTVKDKALNEATFIQHIHVVDHVKPTIKQKSQIIIDIGGLVDLDKYFTFSDNYDSVLDIIFIDDRVDYMIPGIYPVSLHVADQSNNQTTLNLNVTIIDNEAPRIILKTNTLNIDYQAQVTIEYLKSLILAVEDNLDILKVNDVEIISYIDSNYLGTYDVLYRVIDSSKLLGETKLTVHVQDQLPPTVRLIEPVIVQVHSLEPYIYDYLEISDNYSTKDNLTITKTGSITMTKTGSYRVIVKVIDAAKNTTEFPVVVEVVDIIPPTLEIVDKLIVSDFSRPDYEALIHTNDNYDKVVNIHIDDHHIDYSKIGVHEIHITVSDQSNNQTTKTVSIQIRDLSYPEIILKTQQVYIAYGTTSIDYLSYVESIFDTYDKDLTINDIIVTTTLDIKQVGLYQVLYEIRDQSDNKGHAILYIYLNDYEKPIIEAVHMTIKAGTHFDYFNFVSAQDNYDGDISHLVKMNPSFIPLHQTGYYEITFYVHDSSGNYAETKVLLTIESNSQMTDVIYYVAGGLIIVGGTIIYYIYTKKREKM